MAQRQIPALIAALTILGLVGAFLVPRRFRDDRALNEALAAQALLALAKAEAAYRDASGSYSGDLASLADAVKAADLPLLPRHGQSRGYRFGSVEIDETGRPLRPLPGAGRRFAYYAVPETYHVTGIRTLLIDPQGLVYAKDAGSAMPPSAWPASDPASAGWIILDR